MKDITTTTIPKWSFVTIHGLQSAVGQKLNGGSGVVLADPTTAEGVTRYPVRIYAIVPPADGEGNVCKADGGGEVVFPGPNGPEDKKLKAENLTLTPELAASNAFTVAAVKTMGVVQSKGEMKSFLWWLDCYHRARPQELNMMVSYAAALRQVGNKPKEASDLLWARHEDLLAFVEGTSTFPKERFYYDVASCYAEAGEHLHQAVDLVEKIPMDKPDDNKAMAHEVLYQVMQSCDQHHCNSPDADLAQEMALVKLRCAKIIFDTDPDKEGMNVCNLAGAYCYAGDNLEGARYYRYAIDNHHRRPIVGKPLEQIRASLIQAQMTCPGMPLDGLCILGLRKEPGTNDMVITAVEKEHRANVEVLTNKQGERTGYMESKTNEMLELYEITLPTDPDDPEVFSASLLEMVCQIPEPLQNL